MHHLTVVPFRAARRTPAALAAVLLLALALAAGGARAADPLPVANPDPARIAEWTPCLPGTGVTVMVSNDRLGDGRVHVRCALGDQESGVAALQNAGFALEGTATYGFSFVCRIDGLPTPAQEDCLTTPGGDRYWIYLKGRPGGRWTYSAVGARDPRNKPRIDSVEGWAFQGMPVQPMDARGPAGFELPAAQAGSGPAVRSASAWLLATLRAQVAEFEAGGGDDPFEPVLEAVLELQRAARGGEAVAEFAPLFAGKGAWADGGLPGWVLADRLAKVVLAQHATGGDPTDDGGEDLRARLVSTIDLATGGFTQPFGLPASEDPWTGGLVLEALARTGSLVDPAIAAVLDMMQRWQDAEGALMQDTLLHAEALAGLVVARDAGLMDAELDDTIAAAADYLEALQDDAGGVRARNDPDPFHDPSVESTGAAALALALAGRSEAAVAAARWVSRYQVTEEYAGGGVPGEDAPAAAYVGAFLPGQDALRDALVNGPTSPFEALAATRVALPGIAAAGPYGPREVVAGPQSVWFDGHAVGAAEPVQQTVRVVNDDERPVTLGEPSVAGELAGDFALDASDCSGRTLATGERCDVVVRFAPLAEGARQALASMPIAEAAGESVSLSLGGTALPAQERRRGEDGGRGGDGGQGGDGRSTGGQQPPVTPGPPTPPSTPTRPGVPARPRARIGVLDGVQPIGPRRMARLGTLVCPSAGACRVRVPRRVVVTVGGRRIALDLVARSRLRAGQRGALRVRLSPAALAQLGGRRVTVRARVRLVSGGITTSRVVAVRVGGRKEA